MVDIGKLMWSRVMSRYLSIRLTEHFSWTDISIWKHFNSSINCMPREMKRAAAGFKKRTKKQRSILETKSAGKICLFPLSVCHYIPRLRQWIQNVLFLSAERANSEQKILGGENWPFHQNYPASPGEGYLKILPNSSYS